MLHPTRPQFSDVDGLKEALEVTLRGRYVVVALAVLAVLGAPVFSAEEMPPFWVAVSTGGGLDAGPDATPPQPTTEPIATVNAGQTLNLRAKVVGGRRAYMMWPDTYANVGPNTTILAHGFDVMEYRVQTAAFVGTGKWTVTDESYSWNAAQGVITPADQTRERVTWTAPAQPGNYTITVTGQVKFHFRRQAPGGVRENDEDSGSVSRTFTIAVGGQAGPEEMTQQQARQLIMQRFNALGTGPSELTGPSYLVGSPGFWNNVYSVVADGHDEYVCGGWQGTVLDMLDDMRNGSPTEKAVFDKYDYGPVHAYYGGHQAVVIYPKGTDWQQTGTVLDPWPNQRPEAFSIADWKSRFWFGVAPSGVYEGQYPLTGGDSYPTPRLKIPPDHMAILKRLPRDQRDQYLGLTNQNDRDEFIGALPAEATDTVAVAVHSPVKMLVTDQHGRRVGWVDDTTFAYEIPGVDVDVFPQDAQDHGMVALLPRAEYTVQMTADRPGTFGLTRAVPASVSATPLTHARDVPVQPGQQLTYQLSPTMPDTPLMGAGGQATALEPLPTPSAGGSATAAGAPAGGQKTTQGAGTGAPSVTITSPREGDRVPGGRVTVTGTGKPGALIVVSTEARAQDDDELLRDVPGSRHKIEEDGTWQVWVAAPELPKNIMQPMYYLIKAHWVTPNEQSETVTVKVFRAD